MVVVIVVLAVFVAGILVGDSRAPYKGEVERFHKSLASLAEIAAELRCSESVVRKRVSRGLAAMRLQLGNGEAS